MAERNECRAKAQEKRLLNKTTTLATEYARQGRCVAGYRASSRIGRADIQLADFVNYAQILALDFLHTTVRGAKCMEALRIAAERGIVRLG